MTQGMQSMTQGHWLIIKKWARRLLISSLVLGALAALTLYGLVCWVSFPEEVLKVSPLTSAQILDRHGKPLREFLSEREGHARWTPLAKISPWLIEATLAVEDERFETHTGVDPIAVSRALRDNLFAGHIVSGASTITMQVIRLLWPRQRTLSNKIDESILAMRLERILSKDEILEHYLNRAPYGNQRFGVESAAHRYFGKSSQLLSVAEAAFLAGLPQSPSNFNPRRHLDAAKKRQQWVLQRMEDTGRLSPAAAKQAREEPLQISPPKPTFAAPHLMDWLRKELIADKTGRFTNAAVIQMTLDLNLQTATEALLQGHLERLKDRDANNAAVIVLDNKTAELLVMVGSRDFFDPKDGQVNGALSLRQPGSTLKPFTYALAFERGWTPATLIPDIPTYYQTAQGSYEPHNFDQRYQGPVRARAALSNSLNIPAVRAVHHVGVSTMLQWLRHAGFEDLTQDAEYYGLGLTLGGGEVRLIQLASAYMALSQGGLWRAPRLLLGVKKDKGEEAVFSPKEAPRRILKEETARLLTDILSDTHARAPTFGLHGPLSFPYDVAAKTGTSSDFRDLWTVGYSNTYTVAVWVGNFDGSPMQKLSGATGAAPIFRDIMKMLHKKDPPPFPPLQEGFESLEVCALSGALPNEDCPHRLNEKFIEGNTPQAPCTLHQHLWRNPQSGLSTSPECGGNLKREVFVNLPPEYDHWQSLMGYPPTPQEIVSQCNPTKTLNQVQQEYTYGEGDGGEMDLNIKILHPIPGGEYQVDPGRPRVHQKLHLNAQGDPEIERLRWLVNGEIVGESTRPFQATWTLKRGTHHVEAIGLRSNKEVGRRVLQIKVE